MKYLVVFDVSNNRRRMAVVRKCLAFGYRVQKSVFEVYFEQEQVHNFEKNMAGLIDEKNDSVRIYPLDKVADEKIRIIGIGRRIEKLPYKII